jgi:hypothetical protein
VKVQEVNLICLVKKCREEFVGQIIVECSVRIFTAVLKEQRCPNCGSRKVAFLQRPVRESSPAINGNITPSGTQKREPDPERLP